MPSSPSSAPRRRRLAAAVVGTGLLVASAALPAGAVDAGATTVVAAAPAAPAAPQQSFADGRYYVVLKDAPSVTAEEAGATPTPPSVQDAGAAPKAKFDANHPRVKNYEAKLKRQQEKLAADHGVAPKATFQRAVNAFVADLTADQAARLAKDPNVLGVAPDVQARPDYSSTEFLGLPGKDGVWKGVFGGEKRAGLGVVVGVIDSGIYPQSPYLQSPAPQPLQGRPKVGEPYRNADGTVSVLKADGTTATAECQTGPDFPASSCNSTILGAYAFADEFVRSVPVEHRAPHERISPLGVASHGTHVATTILGDPGVKQTIDGADYGTGAGVAPAAQLISYKVCWEDDDEETGGCYTSASVAAIEKAIENNVDVINYSISGNNTSVVDPVAMAFRSAAEAGIFVAASAGNSGPKASTVNHSSPWVTTVAAETFSNELTGTVELSDGAKARGASSARTGVGPAPLVHASAVAAPGAAADDVRLCKPGALTPAAAGKIVLCERGGNARVEKSAVVKEAGGVGMVLVNTTPGSLDADIHAVPTVHTDDVSLIAKAKAGGLTATIVPQDTTGLPPLPLPQIAGFSSRGPSNAVNREFLKPDVAAPGVNVLAGVSTHDPDYHGNEFGLMSGTSMASPNLAGMAALLIGRHPEWSPMAVKSALMTTARDVLTAEGTPNPDNFATGAGSAAVAAADRPGLVYEADASQWNAMILGELPGRQVNVPSVAVPDVVGSASVTRTVTALENGRWTFSGSVPGYTVTASPSTLDLKRGQKAEVTLTFTRTDAPLDQWAHGSFAWTAGKGRAVPAVTSPVSLRSVAAVAGAGVQGTGAAGSQTVTIKPGFTGRLTPTVLGLDKETAHQATAKAGESVTSSVTVGEGVKAVTFAVDSGAGDADWDLLVLTPSGEKRISATEASDESVTITDPAPGVYRVIGQLYSAPAGSDTATVSDVQLRAGSGNLTVTPSPVPVTVGQDTTATLAWSGLTAGTWRGQVQWAPGVVTEVVVRVP